MRQPKTKSPALADRFDLEEAFLATPDTAALKSAVIRAVDRATGDPVVLKYWSKTGSAIDADLRELWRHEMRQVERIRAFPGADAVIVDLVGYGETADAFFVTTTGDLAPLEYAAKHVKADHWLRTMNLSRRRLVLWENLRRLATALGALHGQGVVHGRVNRRAVFTDGGTQADFRLGGFEWCLRVADASAAPLSAIAASRLEPVVFSFLEDWRALGLLGLDMLDLLETGLGAEDSDTENARLSQVDLRPSEIDLLRSLLRPERNRALDAETVAAQLDGVINELRLETLSDNGRHLLALRLGETSGLSAALRIAASDALETDDRDAQMAFVTADLQTGAQLCRNGRGQLFLLTELLAYELHPYRQAGMDETWDVAVCHFARPRPETQLGRVVAIDLLAHRIEVVQFGAASRRLQALRRDALDWSTAFDVAETADEGIAIVRRGLLLAQAAEALYRASEIVPVNVEFEGRLDGRRIVRLAPGDVGQRSRLNEALQVKDAPAQMRGFFQRQEADVDAEWRLTEAGGLGGGGREAVSVRFLRMRPHNGRPLYEFASEGPLPPAKQLFLRLADDSGGEQVLRRRLRMLGVLSTQQELAETLTEPRSRLRSYAGDPPERDKAFQKLDESKQQALESVWSTGPMQLVVGPPGVGKTTLVAELVRRILATQVGARILVSAQAHQALDHLAGAVQKAIAGMDIEPDILLVRSRSRSARSLTGAQTQDRAKVYLTSLDGSPLARSAPLPIRRAVSEMRASAQADDRRDRLAHRERRSFEALVLQSANVLFSTSNSGDLARLVDDRAQFDWVIIEEAAKATGPELLAPQLLSMRRVLIGDHNQLPPFDTDRLVKFLSDHTRVQTALAESDPVIGAIFRDYGLDDLREALADDTALGVACELARRTLLLFESLVTQELDRQSRSNPKRRVATELLQQHRMHPVIGEVISECFYDNRLKTPKSCRDRFAAESPPFEIDHPAVPASPIVFVNLPYMQREAGAAEQFPTFHNPAERQAIISVLAALRPRPGPSGEPPTLAVLAPYKQQVDRLARSIEDHLEDRLQALKGFAGAGLTDGFTGTVDSFQGGEADLVLLSLVRNNDHVGRQALGFLLDPRRMNVLLSRAKWRMVIVGSLDFLKVQARRYSRPGQDPSASPFLSKFVGAIDRLQGVKLADDVAAVSVVDWRDLERAP